MAVLDHAQAETFVAEQPTGGHGAPAAVQRRPPRITAAVSSFLERVTHAETAADLKRIGRDVERTVLARAVKWHREDRVVVDGNRTVVF
jgi:hypothetical protein